MVHILHFQNDTVFPKWDITYCGFQYSSSDPTPFKKQNKR